MGFFDDVDREFDSGRYQSNIPAGAREQGGFTGGQSGDFEIQAPQAPPVQMANQSVGHNGTTAGGMTREQYRDAWQGSGATSMADLERFVAANGGRIDSGNGTVTTPYGEQIDMLQGARAGAGNGKAAWGGVGGPSAPPPSAPPPSAPPPGGALAAMMPSQAPAGLSGGFAGGAGAGSSSHVSLTGGTWDGQRYTATPLTYGGDYHPDNIAVPAGYQSERFNAPADFRATTAEDMLADPGYQFRMQQGAEALQASKAASGMLRSGNTLTALNDYAQGMGSQEFANVDARRKGEYQQAYGNALGANQANNQTAAQAYGLTNQYQGAANQFNAARQDQARQNNFANKFTVDNANNANAQNAWSGNVNAQLGIGNLALGNKSADNSYGVGMANVGLGYHSANQGYDLGLKNNALGYTQAGQQYDLGLKNNALGYTQAANSYALGQGNLGLGWAGQNLAAQGQNFNQGFSLAGMAFDAARQSGAYGGQFGANAQNNAGNRGEAQAAGTLGQGSAWGNFYGGAGNTLMDMAGYYATKKRGSGYGPAGTPPGGGGYG